MRKLLPVLFVVIIVGCADKAEEKSSKRYYRPWVDLGELFHDVQMAHIFPDSKTFVDYTPKTDPSAILRKYRESKNSEVFELQAFIDENFDPPYVPESKPVETGKQMDIHLKSHWDYLTRSTQDQPEYSTLIPLPKQYVVPGGRFREVYYWDSYFTMIGLAASGRLDLFESMLDNFAHLIDTVGFIPNGNRTYYLGRSQPPYFASMVNAYMQYTSPEEALKYMEMVQKEYNFWMNGAEGLTPTQPEGRRAMLFTGFLLNRYWDDFETPRPESYREDIELAEKLPENARKKLYRDLRAAAESGWDFSDRWFAGEKFETIRTTDILPVDLNCLLYATELTLYKLHKAADHWGQADQFRRKADIRRKVINKFMWNDSLGSYQDILHLDGKPTGKMTAASLAPLYFGVADTAKAMIQAKTLEKTLLAPGGILTTPVQSGQQWDAPNGWAPLQWIAIKGLERYGQNDLADRIKQSWLSVNEKVYRNTGKMMEKYNVMDTTLLAGGGEYPTKDGFGWTNGVVLGLLADDVKY